jgi:hypothetical protein
MKAHPGKAKPGTLLWHVGFWATVLWAVTGLYAVLIIWTSRDYYATGTTNSALSLNQWLQAIEQALQNHSYLFWLLTLVVLGWIVCAVFWIKALRQAKISYKAGLKDLFLTIR